MFLSKLLLRCTLFFCARPVVGLVTALVFAVLSFLFFSIAGFHALGVKFSITRGALRFSNKSGPEQSPTCPYGLGQCEQVLPWPLSTTTYTELGFLGPAGFASGIAIVKASSRVV